MPNWQPNWDNVRWDWGAANAAVNALYEAANQLDASSSRRRYLASAAQQQFRGQHSQRFDHEVRDLINDAVRQADELRQAARWLQGASERARQEQRRREDERRRWWREYRDEKD